MSVAAVSIWLVQTLRLVGETQLVAVTYVLLFLQLVLFFQAKGERIYWQLLVLGMAQTAVASALGQGLLFAVLLLAYLMLGTLALALLLMYRELARFDRTASPSPSAAASGWRALVPAAAARPALQFVGAAAELPQVDYRRTLAHQTAGIALGTVLVACPIYLLFPRADREGEYFDEEVRSVGYSKEVSLGEQAGEATLNPDVVMRVQLFDEPSGTPFQLIGEPSFAARSPRTTRWGASRSPAPLALLAPAEPNRADRFTRQHITIEKLNENTLFSMVPAYRVDEDDRLRVDNSGGEIFRPSSLKSQRMEFDLATTGIYQHKQAAIVPWYHGYGIHEDELLEMPDAGPGQPDTLPGLRAAAERVRAQAGIDPDDRIALARAGAVSVRTGEFQYTLEGQKRNQAIDPIEDFVVEHRRGHCEYFAGCCADAPQPGYSVAHRDRLPHWRVELGGRLLSGPPAARPHWGRGPARSPALCQPGFSAPLFAGPAAAGWCSIRHLRATAGLKRQRQSRPLDPGEHVRRLFAGAVEQIRGRAPRRCKRNRSTSRWANGSGAVWRGVRFRFLGLAVQWVAGVVVCAPGLVQVHWRSLPGILLTAVLALATVLTYRGRPTLARWWRTAAPRAAVVGLARRSQSETLRRLESCLALCDVVRLAGQTPFEFAVVAGANWPRMSNCCALRCRCGWSRPSTASASVPGRWTTPKPKR